MATQVNRTKAFHVDNRNGTFPSEICRRSFQVMKNMISNKRQESSNEWQGKEQIVKRPTHKNNEIILVLKVEDVLIELHCIVVVAIGLVNNHSKIGHIEEQPVRVTQQTPSPQESDQRFVGSSIFRVQSFLAMLKLFYKYESGR